MHRFPSLLLCSYRNGGLFRSLGHPATDKGYWDAEPAKADEVELGDCLWAGAPVRF